jgi:hypothetical protein
MGGSTPETLPSFRHPASFKRRLKQMSIGMPRVTVSFIERYGGMATAKQEAVVPVILRARVKHALDSTDCQRLAHLMVTSLNFMQGKAFVSSTERVAPKVGVLVGRQLSSMSLGSPAVRRCCGT